MVLRRATSIRHGDGLLTEHGDGFTLTFSDPKELDQPTLKCRTVAVADGLDILVVTGERLASSSLLIGWRGWTSAYEPLDA